ncbi:MAG: GNAT family N-acetyltransferase [bacterium]|nr:GNAT family N-acetyltransferase [bacterium]
MNQPQEQTEPLKPCRVRTAVAGDAETIVLFNVALAEESEYIKLDPTVVAIGVRAVLDDPHRGRYFMAEIDGQLVGQAQITYEWSDWRAAWFWWLQSVYVHPDHRRRGVFRMLYAYIAAEARGRGDVCGLRLYVEQENAPAIETYARQGMQRTPYMMYAEDWSDVSGRG